MRFPKQIASLGRFSTPITFCVPLPRNENTQIVNRIRKVCFGKAVQLDYCLINLWPKRGNNSRININNYLTGL